MINDQLYPSYPASVLLFKKAKRRPIQSTAAPVFHREFNANAGLGERTTRFQLGFPNPSQSRSDTLTRI